MSAEDPHQEYERLSSYASDLVAVGRISQAVETLSTLLGRFPQYEGYTRMHLARAHSDGDRHDKAVEQARLAVAAMPQEPAAHFELGRALLFSGDAAQAEQPLRTSLQLDPQDATSWGVLAWSLLEMERNEEAFHAGDQAVRLDPDSPLAHYTVGASVVDSDLLMAKRAAESSLRLDPEFAPAVRLLAIIQLRLLRTRGGDRSVANLAALLPQAPATRVMVDIIVAQVVGMAHAGTLLALITGGLALGAMWNSGAPPVAVVVTLLVAALLTVLLICMRARAVHAALPGSLGPRMRGTLRRRPLIALQAVVLAAQWVCMAAGAAILLNTGNGSPLAWALLAGVGACVLSYFLAHQAFRNAEG
ncbi:tetratricopeptide repeat protein [Actinomyces bowdenii]|uniref:tetratricopeptide repeat protein n=1 Tax=Actinomyces bowdenii TaxID=131109 RepID=UPI001ABCF711|nr:tetratricopeptide repeat protein [Actinomyces bowdenii]MBO3725052.1 tetratricopeptide repeat protein [Actinomyces bowdenii]